MIVLLMFVGAIAVLFGKRAAAVIAIILAILWFLLHTV